MNGRTVYFRNTAHIKQRKHAKSERQTDTQIDRGWHRRCQDFVWGGGALLFAKKVVALKDCLNLPQYRHVAKSVLKIDSCSGWGMHFVSGGVHLHIFPVN